MHRTMKVFVLLLSTIVATASSGAIIGGWGDYTFEYIPNKLHIPSPANVDNIHGIAVDVDDNIIVTFQDKNASDLCMVRFTADDDYAEGKLFGPGASLCAGVPHGLRLIDEEGEPFLYHANNAQKLRKTTLDGEIIWAIDEIPDENMNASTYSPTWFAAQDGSNFVYMTDGYGSSKIYVYTKDGKYTGFSFGGIGSDHGQFMTSHSITYDWRVDMMVVSDRENHRLEYFSIDPEDPSIFEYEKTVEVEGLQRPCNIRFDENGVGIIPDLQGPVIIVDENNTLLSVVNVTEMLGVEGFLHPHDAHWLQNGDFVVVTWAPGEIGYFKKQ